jgi:hypothetical protein
MINLQKGDNGGAGLGNDGLRLFSFQIVKVGLDGQFRSEANVKTCLDAYGLEPRIKVEGETGEADNYGRRNYGYHFHPIAQIPEKFFCVVNPYARFMFTGVEAAPAANAHVLVQADIIAAAIVAELDGANADALVAIGAFGFVNPDDFG